MVEKFGKLMGVGLVAALATTGYGVETPAVKVDAQAVAKAEAAKKAAEAKRAAAEKKKAEEAARKAAAAELKAANEKLRAFVKDVNDAKKKIGTVEAVKMLEDFRATDPACTNLGVRVDLDYAILDRCKSGKTPRGAAFDAALAKETVARVAPRIYDDAAVALDRKFNAVDQHCTLLCDQERFDDALALAKRYTEMKDEKGNGTPKAFEALKNVYRLADRYPDALAAMKRAIAAASGKGGYCRDAAKLALEFDDAQSVPEIWKLDTDKCAAYDTMTWVAENKSALDDAAAFRDETLRGVLPFVSSTNNPPNQRFWLATTAGLIENTPDGAALRLAVRDVVAAGKEGVGWYYLHKLKWAFMDGDWARFATVYADLANLKQMKTPELRRAYVYSLAALGRTDEAKKAAATYRAEADKPIDQVKMDVLSAIVEDRDALPLVAAAKLEPKDHARVVQLASQWTLVLQKNDACRRYAEAYAKLIAPVTPRRQRVTWSAKPLVDEYTWRALYPSLEKSFIDVKMCGDLDNLVTDVATGRIAVEKTALDTKDARVEVTAVCDTYGVHVYLRVQDPNARAVEAGFAGGKGTEMYFAPGDNQPYVCFGGDARNPIAYLFQTSYTWADNQRLVHNEPAKPYNMKGEMFFTDGDYVTHLFFPWDAFYQKLPTPGTEWKFECMTDGYSWGGSQGVHESSSWGRLVFDLKPEQLTAIRRRLILKNAKSWKKGEKRSFETVATFDRWADPVIGDPAFYASVLKPLEDELTAYAKRVTPEMTDADVNDIYEHAVLRWIGLRHEIDRLRREYLTKKNLGL